MREEVKRREEKRREDESRRLGRKPSPPEERPELLLALVVHRPRFSETNDKEREMAAEVVRRRSGIEKNKHSGKANPEAGKKRSQYFNPWTDASKVGTALAKYAETYAAELSELHHEVEAILGHERVHTISGIYNAARLHRFLLVNHGDVRDACRMVVLNSKARESLQVAGLLKRLISEEESM